MTRPGQRELKRVICEMGGKNAMIVDADADIDETIMYSIYSAFGFQGQKCSALSRLILLEENYDRVMERLIPAAASLRIGNPEQPGIMVGPVIDEAAYRRISEYIETGQKEATLAYQAKEVPPRGYFIPPTIFTDVKPNMRIAREEIFGPVLSVLKVRDLDAALEVANGTDYALTGGFFSRSPDNIERVKARLEAGNLYINRSCTGAIVGRHPFGGFKMSGSGTKAGGEDYLLNFLVPRVVTENTSRHGFAPEKSPSTATNFSGRFYSRLETKAPAIAGSPEQQQVPAMEERSQMDIEVTLTPIGTITSADQSTPAPAVVMTPVTPKPPEYLASRADTVEKKRRQIEPSIEHYNRLHLMPISIRSRAMLDRPGCTTAHILAALTIYAAFESVDWFGTQLLANCSADLGERSNQIHSAVNLHTGRKPTSGALDHSRPSIATNFSDPNRDSKHSTSETINSAVGLC